MSIASVGATPTSTTSTTAAARAGTVPTTLTARQLDAAAISQTFTNLQTPVAGGATGSTANATGTNNPLAAAARALQALRNPTTTGTPTTGPQALTASGRGQSVNLIV